jgi:hypothetical protein
MKKIFLIGLMLLVTVSNYFASDDFSATAEIKKRKVIVVLLDENQEIIDRLTKESKSSEIDAYRQNLKKDNDITMSSFKEFWKETPLEFISESKVKDLPQAEVAAATLISHEEASIEKVEFLMYDVCIGYSETGKKGRTSFELYHKFFKIAVENEVPSGADILFLLRKIRVYYDLDVQFDLKTLNDKLAKKTLLIDKESTEMTLAEIKDAYEFPVKLVSVDEILTSKNSRDKSTLYLKLDVFKNEGQQAFLLVESESGQILSRSLMGGITKVTINTPSSRGFDATGQYSFNDNNAAFRRCSNCGIVGEELVRLYTARAKLKKSVLKVLASQKIQNSSMFSVSLIPY